LISCVDNLAIDWSPIGAELYVNLVPSDRPATVQCLATVLILWSWESSISIVTDCGIDDQSSIPTRGRIFIFSIVSRLALQSTHPPVQWVLEGISPGVKQM
jgi:hypothetical protein